MGVWITGSLAMLSIVLCLVVSVVEIVKDIKRWVDILSAPEEATEQLEGERPALRVVKTKA